VLVFLAALLPSPNGLRFHPSMLQYGFKPLFSIFRIFGHFIYSPVYVLCLVTGNW
jgi:hypothetical protein